MYDAIFIHELDGTILDVNDRSLELHAATREQLLASTIADLSAPNAPLDQIAQHQQQLESGEVVHFEWRARRLDDNSTFDAEISFQKTTLGNRPIVIAGVRDITDRKRSEQALRESEARLAENNAILQSVIESTPDVIFVKDRAGRIVTANTAFAQFFDQPIQALLGKDDIELWGTEMADHIITLERQIMTSGAAETFEESVPYENELRTYLTTKSPWYDNAGEVIGIIGLARDITDRKQAEESLRAERLRLQLALDAARMGTWSCSLQTEQLVWSDRAQEIFGFVPGTFPGDRATFTAMIHPDDFDRVMQAIAHTFDTGAQYNLEYRIYRQDGEMRWIAVWGIIPTNSASTDQQLVGVISDITDRKLAEQALRNSEARFQAFMNNSPTASWISDTDGVMLYVSRTYYENFQLPFTDIIGKSIFECYPPDIAQQFLDNIQRVSTTNQVLESNEIAPRADGTLGDFLVYKFPIPDTSGHFLVGGVAIDITDRKAAEAAIQQSEQDLRTIFNNVYDAIFIHDLDGTILDVNDRALEMFGSNYDQLIACAIGDLLAPEYPTEQIPVLLQQAQTEGATRVEWRGKRLDDGAIFDMEVTIRLTQLGTRPVLIVSVRNISDRKQAELSLRASEERFRAIFEQAAVGIVRADLEGRLLQVNQQFCDMVGYTETALCLKLFNELTHPDDLARDLACVNQLLAGAGSSFVIEKRYIRQNGETVWATLSVSLVCNTAGEPAYFIGIVKDISDRKQAEQALRESEERFRQLAETVDAVFWLTDLQPQILYVSPAFERVWGRPSEEVFSSHENFINTIHPDDVEYTNANMALRFQGEVDFEYRIQRPDGEVRWIRDQAFPIYNEAGEVYRIAGVAEDITVRKQAEAQVKKQEQFLRSIYEGTSQPIFVAEVLPDHTVRQLGWNPIAERLVGKSSEAVMGKAIDEIFAPDDAREILDRYHQCIVARQPITFEEQLNFQGQTVWMLSTYNPLINEAGRVYRVVSTVFNITDRKQAELEQQKLVAIVENSTDLIGLASLSGESLYLNEAGQRLMGVEASRLNGMPVTAFLSPQGTEKFQQEALPRLMQDGYWYGESIFRNLQTSEDIVVEQTIFLINDPQTGAPLCMATISRDIRDRKQAEQELEEARQFAQSIADRTPAALYIYDMENQRNLYSNRSIVETLGYTANQIQAMGAALMPTIIHPDDLPSVVQHQQVIAAAADGDDLKLEYRMCHADGSVRWLFSLDSVFKRDEQGNVTQYIGAAQDITDRKRLEQELRQINTELEQRVEERTLDLQQAMEAAEAANRSKSTFLANMSHELRTPLNAILGFAQLMSRDLTLEPEKRNQLGIINRSGKHLLSLINDILEMSKIEAGRTSFVTNCFNLDTMLDTLEQMFQLRAIENGLRLVVDRAPTLPHFVETDENKLRQVLINLVSNAIKFTQQGQVALQVTVVPDTALPAETADPIKSSLPSVTLAFEVSDTGIGIAADEIETLFEPFIQSRNQQSSQEGTGLGLAISRQFVQLMGGEFNVESTPGIGSRFRFVIPARVAEVGLSTSLQTRQIISLAPDQPVYRVLVAEDNDTNRRVLVQLLLSIGFDVQVALNGEEAVTLWETWKPHLIWMDMRMPIMNGYEATQQIRLREEGLALAAGEAPFTPSRIIALTASAFEEDRARVLEVGCDDFVRKPFQENELFEKMAEHLGVQYLYADADPLETDATQLSATFDPLPALRSLPLPFLQQLQRATIQLDSQQLVVLLEQVSADQPELTTLLLQKIDNFDLEQILHLVQTAMQAEA